MTSLCRKLKRQSSLKVVSLRTSAWCCVCAGTKQKLLVLLHFNLQALICSYWFAFVLMLVSTLWSRLWVTDPSSSVNCAATLQTCWCLCRERWRFTFWMKLHVSTLGSVDCLTAVRLCCPLVAQRSRDDVVSGLWGFTPPQISAWSWLCVCVFAWRRQQKNKDWRKYRYVTVTLKGHSTQNLSSVDQKPSVGREVASKLLVFIDVGVYKHLSKLLRHAPVFHCGGVGTVQLLISTYSTSNFYCTFHVMLNLLIIINTEKKILY